MATQQGTQRARSQRRRLTDHFMLRVSAVQLLTLHQAAAALCGWRTRAMFDRYNIIDEATLAAAVAKRFNGIEAAKKPLVEQSAEQLS